MDQITSYPSLRAAVQAYMAYDDISTMFDAWLGLAESKFRRDIRIREMESQDDFTIAADSTHALPAGFLQIIDLYDTGASGGALEYLPPQKFWSLSGSRSGKGQPGYYTVLGTDLRFSPLTDDVTRTYSMNYFKAFDPLTQILPSQTNGLLSVAPDVYLYGVLFEAQPYLADAARAAEFEALYRKAIDGLHAADTRSRHRPRGKTYSEGVSPDGAFRI